MTTLTGKCDMCGDVFAVEDLHSGYDDEHYCNSCEIERSVYSLKGFIKYHVRRIKYHVSEIRSYRKQIKRTREANEVTTAV